MGNTDVINAKILTHPIEPNLLEKMADNVKLMALAFIAPYKEKPLTSLERLPWDSFGKKLPRTSLKTLTLKQNATFL